MTQEFLSNPIFQHVTFVQFQQAPMDKGITPINHLRKKEEEGIKFMQSAKAVKTILKP